MEKLSYEQLERRFQSYCKHDGGRMYAPGMPNTTCAVCFWDTAKCQHRGGEHGKYCSQCGEELCREPKP